jgi:hypothetical protein
MSALLFTSQPCSTTRWPTVTSSWMIVGCASRVTWIVQWSWMFVRSPMRTCANVAAHDGPEPDGRILPTTTSPITIASSATHASGCTVGSFPRYSFSIGGVSSGRMRGRGVLSGVEK